MLRQGKNSILSAIGRCQGRSRVASSVAWPRSTARPAFEPVPKLHQLAIVPNELRQNLWADHSHMAAGVAAEPDVVALTLPKP